MVSGAKSGSSGKNLEMSRADYEKRIAAELARLQGEIGILVRALDFLRQNPAGRTIAVPRPILLVGRGCQVTRTVKRAPKPGALPPAKKGHPIR